MAQGTTGYITLADLGLAGYNMAEAANNAALMTFHINLASRMVDDYTGTNFDPVASKTLTVNNVRSPVVLISDNVVSITSVAVVQTTMTLTYSKVTDRDGGIIGVRLGALGDFDFSDLPASGYAMGVPYGYDVTITYQGGWPSVPLRVQEATRLLAINSLRSINEQPPDFRLGSVSGEGWSRSYVSGIAQAAQGMPDTYVQFLLEPYRITKAA